MIPQRLAPEILLEIGRQDTRPVPPGILALAESVRKRYEKECAAVLLYGSCLRAGTEEGVVDLYLLTDGAFRRRRFLLPDVYYHEILHEGRRLRSKLSVLSLKAFEEGTAGWFHSYLWGRFSQPSVLLFFRDEAVAERMRVARARAILTFIARVLPMVRSPFSVRDLWTRGLGLTYRSELRAEESTRALELFEAGARYYMAVTGAGLDAFSSAVEKDFEGRYCVRLSERRKQASRLGWRLRRIQGKALSVLRLAKAALTFRGGTEYLLWKIERHSGVRIETSLLRRRFRPLALCLILWRLFRRRALR